MKGTVTTIKRHWKMLQLAREWHGIVRKSENIYGKLISIEMTPAAAEGMNERQKEACVAVRHLLHDIMSGRLLPSWKQEDLT